MKEFLVKNKVFLLGALAAILLGIQQFAIEPTIDWMSVGVAAGTALLAYIANEWRGQGLTLTGIIGTVAYVIVSNANGQHLDLSKLFFLSIVAILAAVAPPAKPASYEQDPTIKNAKS